MYVDIYSIDLFSIIGQALQDPLQDKLGQMFYYTNPQFYF